MKYASRAGAVTLHAVCWHFVKYDAQVNYNEYYYNCSCTHTHTHTHMGVPIIKQKQMYGSKYTFLVTSVRATWCHQDTPAHSHTKEKGHYSKRRKLNLWPQLLVCYLSHNHPHTHIVSLLTPTHTLSHPFEMQYIHDTISYWTASFKRHWDIPCPTNLHVTYSTAHPPTHSSPNI